MMSCIIYNYKTRQLALRMLCKGCYHISIVLAFSSGQAKTISIRCGGHVFLENGEKISFFQKYPATFGQGLKLTFSCWKLREVKITTIFRRSTKM